MDGVSSSVGEEAEQILLSAWHHPLFSQLTDTEPQVQSDAPLSAESPGQLEVELVKVVVMSKGDRVETCVLDVGPEASTEQPVVAEGDER